MMQLKFLFVGVLCVVLTACGSSGGGTPSTPTDPETVFSLFDPLAFTAGPSLTLNLTGSDTVGGVYQGTAVAQVLADTIFLGEAAVPQQTQLELVNTTDSSTISETDIDYYSTSATDRRLLGREDNDSFTVSAVTTAIPQTAKIGDAGNVGTYTNNAGEVDTITWRLEDGFNGRAKFLLLETTKDQFGNLISNQTTTSLIETDGSSASITLELYLAAFDATLSLNSN